MRQATHRQAGFSTLGLMIWFTILGLVAVFGLRVLPVVNEYMTIKKVVQRIADSEAANEADVRRAFDKAKTIEYALNTLHSADLDVEIRGGQKIVISFAYDKEIEVADPVYLLFKFKSTTR